jgi:hypothetical protein
MRAPGAAEPCDDCKGVWFTQSGENLRCDRCGHLRRLAPRAEPPRSEPAPPRPPVTAPGFPAVSEFRDPEPKAPRHLGAFRPIHPPNHDGSMAEMDVRRWEARQREIGRWMRQRQLNRWAEDWSPRWPWRR